jgi:hypothetical protein
MRVLLDECVDERLRHHLHGHECQTARYAGLAGILNGELLRAAETAEFDVVLTVDQGVGYQQNLSERKIAVVIFSVGSVRFRDLLPHMSACLRVLESIQPGQVVRIR